MDCPIFVQEQVLKNSKISEALSERASNEQLRSYLDNLSDEDLGRYKM
jgi:bifunctional DNase/RNase